MGKSRRQRHSYSRVNRTRDHPDTRRTIGTRTEAPEPPVTREDSEKHAREDPEKYARAARRVNTQIEQSKDRLFIIKDNPNDQPKMDWFVAKVV